MLAFPFIVLFILFFLLISFFLLHNSSPYERAVVRATGCCSLLAPVPIIPFLCHHFAQWTHSFVLRMDTRDCFEAFMQYLMYQTTLRQITEWCSLGFNSIALRS